MEKSFLRVGHCCKTCKFVFISGFEKFYCIKAEGIPTTGIGTSAKAYATYNERLNQWISENEVADINVCDDWRPGEAYDNL